MRKILCAAWAAAVLSCSATAGTVTVLTSFPKELTDIYKKRFEDAHPGIRIEVLNKNTTAAIAHIREAAAGQRPDIMWASAPDAFEALKRDRLLARVPEVRNPFVPARIGNYPISDADEMFFGQALSGYGIMTNSRYLQANKLPAPKEWADLARGVYHGHVAMSSPAKSGTTHLTVETILQGEGWEKGWAQLLQIAGNCAVITERSFGVPEGVNSGQYGAGLVIDFMGLAGKYSGFPVEFVYPSVTAVVPASIALVAGGKNAAEARKFAQYTLSLPGQELLFEPAISRLPVLPYTVAGLKVPGDYPNIYSIARKARVQFDSRVSEERRQLVSTLFDQMITLRHKELQAATRAIHEAERKLAGRPNPKAADLLKRSRGFAFVPLVDERNVQQGQMAELLRKNRKDAAVARQIAALEELWGTRAKASYERAEALAREAAALVK